MKKVFSLFVAGLLIMAWTGAAFAQDKWDEMHLQNVQDLDNLLANADLAYHDQGNAPSQGTSGCTCEKLPFKLSGELRIREELFNHRYAPGANMVGRDSMDFTHMRTRLRLDWAVEEDLDAVIEFQDVRVWGSELNTVADTAGVDLKRSKIRFKNLFDKPLTLDVGRYVMAYGDQRLIGHLEWFDQGRTYDGFRFSYEPEGDWFADFFGVRITDFAATDANDQDLLGVYAGNSKLADNLGLEGYVLLLRDQRRGAVPLNLTERRFVTVGTRVFGGQDAVDYTGEFAAQLGDVGPTQLRAYAFALKGGFTLSDCDWKTRCGAELAHASGDRLAGDNDSEQFQTLFPTNHMHYGYADLVGWSNIWDYMVGLSTCPNDDVKLALNFHHFMLDDTDGGWINAGGGVIRRTTTKESRHLGDEVDLTATWKASDALSFLAGYSHFFTGQYVEDTAPVNAGAAKRDMDFVYVQGRVRF